MTEKMTKADAKKKVAKAYDELNEINSREFESIIQWYKWIEEFLFNQVKVFAVKDFSDELSDSFICKITHKTYKRSEMVRGMFNSFGIGSSAGSMGGMRIMSGVDSRMKQWSK